MNKEKFEVPVELDAKILEYAARKKYRVFKWDKNFFVKAAAVFLVAASAFYFRISLDNKSDKSDAAVITANSAIMPAASENISETASVAAAEIPNWNEFEEKLEYVDNEIIDEIKYLAQL